MVTLIKFIYKNWKGKVTIREVDPVMLWFGKTEYHNSKEEQWFLKAIDVDKEAERDFALKDIIKFM